MNRVGDVAGADRTDVEGSCLSLCPIAFLLVFLLVSYLSATVTIDDEIVELGILRCTTWRHRSSVQPMPKGTSTVTSRGSSSISTVAAGASGDT